MVIRTRPAEKPIQISVVIPTRDRVGSALDAVRSAIVPGTAFRFEFLVLDNGNNPLLETETKNLSQVTEAELSYVAVPEPGLHNGRHEGTRCAQGNLVVFVDDDIIAAPGWLQAIVETFQDPEVHIVGGRSLPLYEAEPPEWLEAFWSQASDSQRTCGYLSLVDLGDQPFEMDPNYIWGLNFAIRKRTLEMLGGFHPDGMPWKLRRYRGDGESAVTRKAKELGLKALYQPDALVYHRIPKNRLTVDYFERRAYLQGISDSFTHIRASGGLIPQPIPSGSLDWKAPLRRARNMAQKLLKPVRQSPTDPYQEIKDRVHAAYQAGYQYHQDEVRSDPVLLEWVLRSDYWNAVVPDANSEGS